MKKRIHRNRPIKKKCLFCGDIFSTCYYEASTCSRKCQSKVMNFPHNILDNIPKGKKRAIYEVVQSKRSKHPKTGKFKTNHAAKYWSIKSPSGVVYQFQNLEHFVRKNQELFSGSELKKHGSNTTASLGLSRLRPTRIDPIASWKGWKWHYIHSNPELMEKEK